MGRCAPWPFPSSEVGAAPSIILNDGNARLSNKIVGSQHNGSVGLRLLFEELSRCSLFNYFSQPHKLIYALIWPHVTPTFKIVHRRGADRAQNYLALIAAAALQMIHFGRMSLCHVDR
jgi:hypothetical protein